MSFFLLAAAFLEAARYRACASRLEAKRYRACASRLEAKRYRACASRLEAKRYRACASRRARIPYGCGLSALCFARSRSRILNDAYEGSGIQTRATDQRTIDILFFHQSRDIVGLYATTVQDAKRIRCSRVVDFREDLSDFGVHFGSNFRGGRAPGADRPYRLVSDNDMGKRRFGQPAQADADLPADDFNSLSGIAFREYLSHAYDCIQATANRSKCLLFHGLIGFSKILPPLGVTDDRIGTSDLS